MFMTVAECFIANLGKHSSFAPEATANLTKLTAGRRGKGIKIHPLVEIFNYKRLVLRLHPPPINPSDKLGLLPLSPIREI